MQVEDRLSSVAPGVEDRAVAGREALVARDLLREEMQLADERRLVGPAGVERCDMLARDHQHVRGRLWRDVAKGERVRCLGDDLRRDRAVADLAE